MIEPTKRDLRRGLLAARRAMSVDIREDHDNVVRATVRSWLSDRGLRTVAAYHPMIGEPGGPSLPAEIATLGVRVLLPVVLPDRDLDWAAYAPESLAPAAMGLTEPTGDRLGVEAIATVDVILVPALAVDRTGARLGRGGGSYDRALARVRSPIIALLYPGELVEWVPREAHDRPVDGVMIDGRVQLFTSGGRLGLQ